MNKKWIPPAALAVTMIASAYGVVQLQGQSQSQVPAADLTNATTAEVRDAQGQVLLRGQFAAAEVQDDETERLATLTPTGVDADRSLRTIPAEPPRSRVGVSNLELHPERRTEPERGGSALRATPHGIISGSGRPAGRCSPSQARPTGAYRVEGDPLSGPGAMRLLVA